MDNSTQNKVEGQRFGTGVEYQKSLLSRVRTIQASMLDKLPSNYTRSTNTNLAEFFRSVAEEFARFEFSSSEVSDDKFHTETRAENLFLVLGDMLFLGERSINENLADTEYRDFLINVRNGYFGGSRPDNLEATVSDILSLPVILKEVYLSLRIKKTSYTVKDTHKMFFDIAMDNVGSSSDIGSIISDLKFFLDLIRPAHVLYDTRLVWTENIDKRGDCTPEYETNSSSEIVYYSDKMYVVTYVASRVYLTAVETGQEGWSTGVLHSIDLDTRVIKLTNNKIVVYTSSTKFYSRNAQGNDSLISPTVLEIGDEIKYFATKDSSSTSTLISSEWEYTGTISSINSTDEVITLSDSSSVVYNSNTLVYTRDGDGEYRINLSDLYPSNELIFKGKKYTETFDFYNIPEQVQDNSYKQFDQEIIDLPYFQKNVKKVLSTRDGLPEGYHVIVEDGVVKVVDVESRFYARKDTKNFIEKQVYIYSLFIDDTFQSGAQFSITEPQEPISSSQAKEIFINQYGYSELENSSTNYSIRVSETSKLFDSTNNSIIESVEEETQACDRDAECQLIPFYEDTRKYWSWPEVRLTSGFIVLFQDWDIQNNPGEENVPAYYAISEDSDQYVMPLLPVLDSAGNPASESDLIVYVNGLKVDDSIFSLDPWTGIVTFNFLPPFNSTIRVDYYYADRYPKPNSYIKEFRTEIQDAPGDNNLGAEYTIIGTDVVINKLLWPFNVEDPSLSGDTLDHQVNKFPIMTNKGKLATASDVVVSVGSLVENGNLVITRGSNIVVDTSADFSSVAVDDTIIITAVNYLDSTLVYTVEEVIDSNTILLSSEFPPADLVPPNKGSDIFPYRIINFLEVENAVFSIKPLLGHIRLNFIPPSCSFLKFDFYYTHYNRKYVMTPDELEGSIPDTVFNSYDNYTIIPDLSPTYNSLYPYTEDETVLKIGYRYRVFNLSNSSVLNSSDTFSLNSFEKQGAQGSFKNNSGNLNEFELMFSPEYLEDTDNNIVLNDKYLDKNIPASTQLYKGTPPFVQTYNDDAHFVYSEYPDTPVNTYEGQTAAHKDLQAGFTIIGQDKSGDIEYNRVCDYKTHRNINLYSDLEIKKFNSSGTDLPLSTINEGSKTLPISTTMIEQYYPNRELRVNDYLDFVNKVPDDLKYGSVKLLGSSRIIKSRLTDLRSTRRGDTITVKNVAVIKWDPITLSNRVFYEDQRYVITNIIDHETAEINKPFSGASNEYNFELERDVVFNVDVRLNEVQRKLVLNGLISHSYSLPDSLLQHYPGYGDTGINFVLNFSDPDPDPYPRNPDNPEITGLPTGDPNTLFTDYTGQETQVPLTSEVIYTDGSTYATGISGFTGPSGAVDLGLTGPVGTPNPRVPSLDNDPVYNIPSAESGIFLSYSESEYRVQWRNWDQDMLIIGFGETGAETGQQGILVEDPVNMLDDIGEGIKRSFWSTDNYDAGATGIVDMYFFGSVIESSESVEASVPKATYSDALVPLNNYQARVISSAYREGLDPVVEYPEFNLNDTNYEHRQLIIRELLHDNSFRVTEIRQYEPI